MARSRVPAVGRWHRDRGLVGPAGRPPRVAPVRLVAVAALVVGTAGSLAANVVTAGPATISRLIAGWPALAVLIAVKLLSGMLDRDAAPRPAVPDVMPSRGPGNDAGPGDDAIGPARRRAWRRPCRSRFRSCCWPASPSTGPYKAAGWGGVSFATQSSGRCRSLTRLACEPC